MDCSKNLEQVKIAPKLTAVYIGISGLNRSEQSVMNKNILLFRLHQEIALVADVTQKPSNI